MKNRNYIKKIVSLMLMLYTVISSIPNVTFADISDTIGTVSESDSLQNKNNGITIEDILAGEATWADIYTGIDETTVPEAVGIDRARARLHTERMYREETSLNEVVFRNIDGTKTVYWFDYPVKYINDYGIACDISLEIADTTKSAAPYETANGNAVTAFSNRYSDGINLSGNNVSVTLLPILPTVSTTTGLDATANAYVSNDATASNNYFESTATRIDKKTISYKYDDSTSVEYSLTYTGFKEDIVVKEYTGQTEYDFTLVTNGLKLEERKNSFYLVDENDNIKATLGNIIIFTADNSNNAYGDMTYKTVVENEKYVLTIHVSDEYLRDEKTKYPIRIDPTIEINYDNDGAGAIADITINTADPLSGTDGEISLGKWGSDQSVSRILMKFPGLNLSSIASAAQIQSATVELHDLMCQHEELDVYCYVFTGNEWSESNATWDNVNANSYGPVLSYNTVSYFEGLEQETSQRYKFNITAAVQGWKAGYYDPDKGVIFKAPSANEEESTHNYKTFASYNRSNHKPTLTITYTDSLASVLTDATYYINNSNTGKYLYNNSIIPHSTSGLIADLGDSIRWEVCNVNGGCIIRSAGDTTQYLGVTYDMTGVQFYTVIDTEIPEQCIWNVSNANEGGCLISYYDDMYGTMYLCAGVSSTVGISSYLDNSGSYAYKSCTWRIASTDYLGTTDESTTRELSSLSFYYDKELEVGESTYFWMHHYYEKEIWTSADDFDYYVSVAGKISIDKSSSRISTMGNRGGTLVTATHKVTNRVKTFYVFVGFSSTISSTPVPSSIIEALNEPHNVWPASEQSRYYGWEATSRSEDLQDIYNIAFAMAVGGNYAQMDNSSRMLLHFLNNQGTLYTIDMSRMLSEWDKAQNFLKEDMDEMISAVESSAKYTNKTIRYISAKDRMSGGYSDWNYSVGNYYTYITCTYKKTASSSYTAVVTYSMHDAYDWDRNDTQMGVLPVSPSQMWELHHGGIAKNYEVRGSVAFTMTWSAGQTYGNGVVINYG